MKTKKKSYIIQSRKHNVETDWEDVYYVKFEKNFECRDKMEKMAQQYSKQYNKDVRVILKTEIVETYNLTYYLDGKIVDE